ncbi:putative recombination hotspot-binding protein [Phaeomoniella chlamydospora]|uniref:Putative recombination hotspot-binding protein n=1 Tax=Phaeomoniella chlamydospora TaxID=158046 RepID=A0A0G2DZP8_PHACM|nr:putative recombination hotspot-binding protein [Phaeomoniella chlamydospora]
MADIDMASTPNTGIDPAIFERLQAKIDEESKIRDELKEIVQTLEKQDRFTQSILSKAHSTPSNRLNDDVVNPASASISAQNETIRQLSEAASQHPFYKYNGMWSRTMQELIGEALGVPVNLKDRDAFHVTIEEYLLALTNLLDELARLAVNSVTLGDFSRPLAISKFIKDIHAGFQLLNLKNDALRRRSDSIKYNVSREYTIGSAILGHELLTPLKVKKVEDVVYDLSLRGLLKD